MLECVWNIIRKETSTYGATLAKILLTGGGTAGHITPNLALIPELKRRGHEVFYVCGKSAFDTDIVDDAHIPYFTVSGGKLRRYFDLKNLSDIPKIAKGYFESKKIIEREKPDVVFSKGGFITVPVVWAAAAAGVPVVLHESDRSPGLANRLCMKKAMKICLSFPGQVLEKYVLTGCPVREEVEYGKRSRGLAFLGFSGQKPILLIFGGSQGAEAINLAFDERSDEFIEKFDVVHIRGAGKLKTMKNSDSQVSNPKMASNSVQNYRQFEYIKEQLPDVFAAADIVIARSGANTVFEMLTLKKPALYVPLPLGASRGDQIENAMYFENRGMCKTLMQENIAKLFDETLKLFAAKDEIVSNIENSPLASGRKNVADVIESVIRV